VYSVHRNEAGELEYEWDLKKAEQNLRKHGVEFVDAVIVLDDDRAVTLVDEHPSEERYVTFGSDAHGRVLAISYAVRGSAIRIISARKATSRERAQYEGKGI
jgi:uncharacterized DUF497 family protein